MTSNNINSLLYQHLRKLKKRLHEDESMLNFYPLADKEDHDYYVVVAENDKLHEMPNGGVFYDDEGPLVFEQYLKNADINSIKERAMSLRKTHGSCRIARLDFDYEKRAVDGAVEFKELDCDTQKNINAAMALIDAAADIVDGKEVDMLLKAATIILRMA